jgi:hypothetical protein
MNGFMAILKARGSEIRAMSDIDLAGAIHAARGACQGAWAAWEAVRDAGQTDLRCPEFQAHNAAQNELGALKSIWSEREMSRKIAMFGTVWDGRA